MPKEALLILFGVIPSLAFAAPQWVSAKHETASLAFQEQTTLPEAKLDVQFVGYRDHRCPSDLQCAWAGEAQAFLWVSGAGLKPQLVTLAWDGSNQPERLAHRVGRHLFYLESMEPRPNHSAGVVPMAYRVVLRIAR